MVNSKAINISKIIKFFAFGFGSGNIPVAPGTFGTLAAVPFYLLLTYLPLSSYCAFVFIFTLFSIWIADKASKSMGIHDDPRIVIDEFAGFFVTMINAPLGFGWLVLGFALFRLFDVIKPWPIRWLDAKVKGGFGIVIDDIIAGIFGFLIMQMVHLII